MIVTSRLACVSVFLFLFANLVDVQTPAYGQAISGTVVGIALDPVLASPTGSYDDSAPRPKSDFDLAGGGYKLEPSDSRDGWVKLPLKAGGHTFIESYAIVLEQVQCADRQDSALAAGQLSTGLGAGASCGE